MNSLHGTLMLTASVAVMLMAAPSISALAKDETTAKQLVHGGSTGKDSGIVPSAPDALEDRGK